MFSRLKKYFALKKQFNKIIEDAVRIDGKKIKAIHINHWYGFIVNIGAYTESRWISKELATVFYLKGTEIELCLNSPKTQHYFIEWKD